MRLAAFEDIEPSPEFGYGYARAYHILSEFEALGHEMTLVPLCEINRDLPAFKGLPGHNGNRWKLISDVERFCNTQLDGYDVIWISRPKNLKRVLPLVRRTAPGVPVVYDAEAIGALREIRRREVTGVPFSESEAEQLMASEFALMRECDVIVSVSRREADLIARRTARPTYLVGHPCHICADDIAGFEERRGLLFVGSFFDIETDSFRPEYSPNLAAIQHYFSDVAPLVRFDSTLEIIGFGSLRALDHLEIPAGVRVNARGFEPSLRPFYRSAALFIAPTIFAAGIPWKVTEAFSEGIPVVMTRLLADQLGIAGDDFLVADSPQQFAERIDTALRDLRVWRSAQEAGFRYVREHCDPAHFSLSLGAALARARTP